MMNRESDDVRELEVMEIYNVSDSGVYSIIRGVDLPGKGFGESFVTFGNREQYGKPTDSLEKARRGLEAKLGNEPNIPCKDGSDWLRKYLVYNHTEQPAENGGCF